MQVKSVSISTRFRGPSRSGNGGYCCGLLGSPIQGAATVRLFSPPPLETQLALWFDADSSKLLHGDTIVGEARRCELDLIPPPAPSFSEAEMAAKNSALDCPGAFAVIDDLNETQVLLGQLTARIDKSVSAGQRCIAIGWPAGQEGRKYFAGTAVFAEHGDLIAVAKATWIAVEKGRFE